MNPSLNRRTFLKAAAAFSVAALATPRLSAADPARFPVAIRDAQLKATGLPDCWAAIKELGVDGIEANIGIDMACLGLFHPQNKYTLATPDGIAALKKELADRNVSITAFMMSNRFDARRDEELAWMRKLVAACAPLGVKTIRIDLVPSKIKRDEFLPFAIKVGKEIAAIAGDAGVRLGIENHGNTTNDPEFLDKLFDGVGAKNLGLTLDTANFYWYGHPLEDLYKLFEKFAPRAFHTHCKSIRYPDDKKNIRREMGFKYREYTCPITEGDIDFARVARILRAAAYSGDFCLENESLEKFPAAERTNTMKKEIALLRSL